MKRTISLLAAGLLVVALTAPGLAQEEPSAQPDAKVGHQGTAEIIVKGAPGDGLNLAPYRAFDRFAADHPQVVHALGKDPQLLDSDKYLARHPELDHFLDAHPDIKSDFDANPGNYVYLEPGVEKAVEMRSKRIELVSPLSANEAD